MAMKSTWNRTCFPNLPGCCMYRLPYEKVGPDIKGSRWVALLLSVSWNWHLHTASGQRVFLLFISHSRGDRCRQCLCLGQSKIRQTSSGRVVLIKAKVMGHCSYSARKKTVVLVIVPIGEREGECSDRRYLALTCTRAGKKLRWKSKGPSGLLSFERYICRGPLQFSGAQIFWI